jgi:hypothetical protein
MVYRGAKEQTYQPRTLAPNGTKTGVTSILRGGRNVFSHGLGHNGPFQFGGEGGVRGARRGPRGRFVAPTRHTGSAVC